MVDPVVVLLHGFFIKRSTMKYLLALCLFGIMSPAFAVTWSYQVNINNTQGGVKKIDSSKNSFEAGPYYCEVTPVTKKDGTEFRTLVCAVGAGTVSTGGLCTKEGAKFPSVQYAILNLNGPKNLVNVVVSCSFNK
jgi:hypothetical protein